eukprot:5709342-Prymnesium_polylepis.1
MVGVTAASEASQRAGTKPVGTTLVTPGHHSSRPQDARHRPSTARAPGMRASTGAGDWMQGLRGSGGPNSARSPPPRMSMRGETNPRISRASPQRQSQCRPRQSQSRLQREPGSMARQRTQDFPTPRATARM